LFSNFAGSFPNVFNPGAFVKRLGEAAVFLDVESSDSCGL
jgi:hypothetical protein